MEIGQKKKMNITINKSSIIPPSKTIPESSNRLWTSNLDLVVGRIHILTVYFYRPNGSSTFFDPIAMKKALADVLVSFYPMAGRLDRDESGRIVINCNGEGALFVEAEADSSLDDFGEFTPSPEFRRLTPEVDYSGDISSYPLFFAQYHPPPTMITTTQKSGSLSKSSTTMLKLTLEQLNTLKAKAKNEGGPAYSTYEILAAHIWRCACKARGLSDDQLTKLYVATDGRSRLSPRLPPGYLGNVVFTATPVAKSGSLTSESLSNAAKLIHTTLTQMDNEYLRSAIDYLETQPNLSALIRGPSYFASPNLNINAWTRLPVYDADFGWGRPIFMGPATILYEGTIYVLPSPNNDRSVSLAVCLDAKEQPLFENYLYDL
ncbi:hypothetical protein E3N88_05868 [Mikania micrantha]|uniref:Uncharacterized protein n=1 Tax=Mikania micrantha TaxID=192012 RepID=A0A5N6PN17_9ASTR|nr:hypothetical protein E3N88_05868 [Mikania micrantha]